MELDTKISEEKESAKISNFRTLQFQFRTLVAGVRNSHTLDCGIRTLISIVRNCPSAWCSCLWRPYLPHFSSKLYMVWIVGFLTFWDLKWYVERKKWTSGSAPKVQWKTVAVSPVFITLFSSSPLFFPCILWTTKAKDYEAPKLGFFLNLSFQKLCHELYAALPHSWIALV